jgi:PAS domain S-box-containing protein
MTGLSNRGLLLVALGASVLAVSTLVGYLIWSGYLEAKTIAETTSRNYASIIEARLDATLRRADAHLQELARELPRAALNAKSAAKNSREWDARMDLQLRNFPELAGLRVFDANGETLYTTARQSLPNTNVFDRRYFQLLRGNPQTNLAFEVAIARITGRPSVIVARALRDDQGTFNGTVNAIVELDYFQTLFKALDVGAHGVISIYRSDVFTPVVRWPAIADKTDVPLPPETPTRVALSAGQKTGTLEFRAPSDGVVRTYSFHAVAGYPFYVTVGIAREDALAGWKERSIVVGLSSVLLAILVGSLVFYLWRAGVTLRERDAWFGAAFEQAAVGMALRDTDPRQPRVRRVNQKLCDMLGYPRDELLQLTFLDITAPDEKDVATGYFQRLAKGEIAGYVREKRYAHKDGHIVWANVSVSAIYDADHRPTLAMMVIQDISARKQAEERFEKVNRARIVLSECSRALVHADNELQLLQDMCRIAVHLGGYRMAWVGFAEHDDTKTVRPVAQAGIDEGYLADANISWGDNERGRGPSGRAIRLGKTYVVRNALTDPHFAPWRDSAIQRGFCSHIALPLINAGNPFGVLSLYATEVNAFDTDEVELLEGLAADLAYGIMSLRAKIERTRAEAALARLNSELEDRVTSRTAQLELANQELSTFSYTAAHDLRAPLRVINGFCTQVLRSSEGKLDDASIHSLKRIVAASERMGHLIDDLLNLTRISDHFIRRQKIDFSALAAEVVASLRAAHPQRAVSVTIQPHMSINGDRGLLLVVLENLIGNAWKFTTNSSAATIEIDTAQRDGETAYRVRDNGAGFDMTYAHKLFAPFQRLHHHDQFEGTGIGLATVRKIIQRHGGKIWIEGAVNRGATVSFSMGAPA